ncbi:MAG: ABC transporter permease [SAR324 cluster bacterium]|jgi:simple sugar transport system permease protein|nr:ABC transporter permease [SAR324 cluster bacterium]MDP7171324.1 ABC transporter permease [SAR324 cluster bacterium]MDP7437946.1 ABC transporter permease [SAR324 cluster bacterium]HCV44660.1 ABC transporter permease [Deltaproteobacteria bacterium]|tara:strand:- start:1120 stop:2049 length:930 start_codon:yes stop_codon:yes gene_type:complete
MEFFIQILIAAVGMGTPLLFATLGGVISERAGVINLGMEGLMLIGALVAFVVMLNTGNYFYSVVAAALASGTVSMIHGIVCLMLRASQIASGLAMTFFGAGLSGLLGDQLTGETVEPLTRIPIPGLNAIPILGRALFNQDLLVYFSYLCVALSWWMLFKTRLGLNIRSMGEAPEVCDSLGLSVLRYRFFAVVGGGMLIGVGGAYFPLALTPFWVDGITAGRGWIAVALVIFAFWDPVKALGGAYLFGLALALELRLQILGIEISPYFLKMLPYILTILVLTLVTIRHKRLGIQVMPLALGNVFFRGEKH